MDFSVSVPHPHATLLLSPSAKHADYCNCRTCRRSKKIISVVAPHIKTFNNHSGISNCGCGVSEVSLSRWSAWPPVGLAVSRSSRYKIWGDPKKDSRGQGDERRPLWLQLILKIIKHFMVQSGRRLICQHVSCITAASEAHLLERTGSIGLKDERRSNQRILS